MTKHATWLLDHRRDVHSQTGEDGVIEKILDTLQNPNGWCVEFGAWDGFHLSNTRNLIQSRAYSAVLIEGDKDRFQELRLGNANEKRVHPINAYVGFDAGQNLDTLLSSTETPVDFDLLSIDIDGNDFHVWKAASHYRPKVVVIEFNPTIPTSISFVQPADPNINQGSSLLALVELAKEKGYELVCVLPFNAFFVRRDFYALFELESNSPEILRTNTDLITHLFSGFDGTIFLHGNRTLPWHNIHIQQERIQQLPAVLRRSPDRYSRWQKTLFALCFRMTWRKALARTKRILFRSKP